MNQYWNKDRIWAFVRLLARKTGFYVVVLALLVFCMATMPLRSVQIQTAEVQIESMTHQVSGSGHGRSNGRFYFGGLLTANTERSYSEGYFIHDTQGGVYWLQGANPGLVPGTCCTLTYLDGGTVLKITQGDRVLLPTQIMTALSNMDMTYFCILLAASVFLVVLILRGIKQACWELKLQDYAENPRE